MILSAVVWDERSFSSPDLIKVFSLRAIDKNHVHYQVNARKKVGKHPRHYKIEEFFMTNYMYRLYILDKKPVLN